MAEFVKKLASMLENKKIQESVFWLVLSGCAIYGGYRTLADWNQVVGPTQWVETDCRILDSRIEKEAGNEYADLFVVRYQYYWDSTQREGQVYRFNYNGSSYYPKAKELISKYPVGTEIKCFVNPADPRQAILERECVSTMFFLFVPLALFITSVTHFYATWNPEFAARLRQPPQTLQEKIMRWAWKPIKWIVMSFGFIILMAGGIWFIIGLAGVLFLFVGFPMLVAGAMPKEIRKLGDELAKLQVPADVQPVSGSEKLKLRLTGPEKSIIGIAAIIWGLIMTYYITYKGGTGPWDNFGIMFMAIWFGGVITIITFTVLKGLRKYHRNQFTGAAAASSVNANVPPRIKVMKLAAALLAFIGIGGFATGFVCAFITMSGKPMVSTWARFPLGSLECIAVDRNGNIYCGLAFYGRIQAYSAEGKFIRGWFLNANGGVFHMKIDDDDNLHVGTARGNNHYIFSTNGQLLSSGEISPKERKIYFEDNPYQAAEDNDGNPYVILPKFLVIPKVVKITPTGEALTIVSDPFYLWFVQGPFPAFIWIFIGGLVLNRLDKNKKPWHRQQKYH